ncbi:small cell adhesion glycoprotein homolog [Pempheris klunzingeri]|uniref:small cell adhesion glycoprotein homolog n=1 Tax=Pempheris klunzingeri TaxID=3127111 RepID=UPI003981170D
MDAHVTPAPGVPTPSVTPPPLTEAVTETVTKAINVDDGAFAALIGGIIAVVLLLLICVIMVLLWCLSRHKGSYVTNEMDEDDDIEDGDDEDEDDESVGSDTALQSREPQKIREEE